MELLSVCTSRLNRLLKALSPMAQETKLTPHFTPASSANVAPQASPRVTESRGAVEVLLAERGKGHRGQLVVLVGLAWLRFMSKFPFTTTRSLLLDRLPHETLFFAVLIEGLLVNVLHDRTFPLLLFISLPVIMWTLGRGRSVGHGGNKYYLKETV